MRGVTQSVLVELPLTPVYFVLFYLAKSYLIKTKIYPMRFSLINFVQNVVYSLSLEWAKRSNETLGGQGGEELPTRCEAGPEVGADRPASPSDHP